MTAMQRRSWYLPADVAEQLAATVDDFHFATRQPKHAVLAAAVAVALDHQDEISARLDRISRESAPELAALRSAALRDAELHARAGQ